MKKRLTIVKVGGNIIENEQSLQDFTAAFASIKGYKLLVHGGGKVATSMAKRLGVESQLIEGRRITGDDMIDVAVMTYAGLVNKKIVAFLHQKGVQSVGLTGADGNSILAEKRPIKNGIDYGWVGDVKEVNGSFLQTLIETGTTPVFCALTHDGNGHMLNTNADTIANEVAIAMSSHFEVNLNYCFELKGVMKDVNDPDSLIPDVNWEMYKLLKDNGIVSEGMIPKLDNAFDAIRKGVSKVNVLNVAALNQLDNQSYHEYTTLH